MEEETGSRVSSCCDIDWSRSPWRTAALYLFPGPNKYWNKFQPNTISNSAILSPSGSNTASCNRQAERASPPSWINLLLSEAFEVMGSHLWSALSAEHMCHFFFSHCFLKIMICSSWRDFDWKLGLCGCCNVIIIICNACAEIFSQLLPWVKSIIIESISIKWANPTPPYVRARL